METKAEILANDITKFLYDKQISRWEGYAINMFDDLLQWRRFYCHSNKEKHNTTYLNFKKFSPTFTAAIYLLCKDGWKMKIYKIKGRLFYEIILKCDEQDWRYSVWQHS